MGESRETSKEAPCGNSGEGRGSLDQNGKHGGGEKWLDLRRILKVEVTEVAEGFSMWI